MASAAQRNPLSVRHKNYWMSAEQVPLSVRQRICGNNAKQVPLVSPYTLEGAMGTSDTTQHAMHDPKEDCAAQPSEAGHGTSGHPEMTGKGLLGQHAPS